MKKSKGFIGPIGDDLPSLIMIVLALMLFFSGVVFCLDAYNQKIDNMHILTGAMDIARAVTSLGYISDSSSAYLSAESIAKSYGLKYDVKLGADEYPSPRVCDENTYVFHFLVAKGDLENGDLETLELRVCR